MNTEAMLRLADVLEIVEDDAFQMETWWEPVNENICGAAACVAGWAVISNPRMSKEFEAIEWEAEKANFPFAERGRRILGLTQLGADQLFSDATAWAVWLDKLGCTDEVDGLGDITAKHAVMVLRGLASGELTFFNVSSLINRFELSLEEVDEALNRLRDIGEAVR